MITRSQACATIGFTLAVLFSYQVSGDELRPGASRSFTDNVSGAGSQQSAISDRSGERLNSDGAMLGANLRRTRVYHAQGLQEPKSVLWKTQKLFALRHEETFSGRTGSAYHFGDVITSHTALSLITTDKEGYCNFRTDDGYWFVIDLQNGEVKKRFKLQNGFFSVPVVAGDLLFLGMSDGSFSAFDRHDWKAKWQIGRKGYDFALTGQEKWIYRTKKPCLAPVIAKGVIYVASFDNMLLAIDAESGQEKWKYKTPHPPYSYPVIGNGVIYYLDEEGVMYALGSS